MDLVSQGNWRHHRIPDRFYSTHRLRQARLNTRQAGQASADQRDFSGGQAYPAFHHQVVRDWQLSPEPLLMGSLPLVSLALISMGTEAELPGVIKRSNPVHFPSIASMVHYQRL